ncbi:hypothetical protein [Methylophaga sp.]|uniref:hypothetical protein n=1 Tax=Methylophaga sp. TaxID=2024840 RepID=UPI003A95ABEC
MKPLVDFIVGIDPDTDKHGVALYANGELVELRDLDLMGLRDYLEALDGSVVVSIEDIVSVSAIYNGRFKRGDTQAVKSMKAQNVGMCKHAQVEVERLCEHLGLKVIKQRPSKIWKDAKNKQFKLVTGWTKRSNEDQRSAAYMGFQAINQISKGVR